MSFKVKPLICSAVAVFPIRPLVMAGALLGACAVHPLPARAEDLPTLTFRNHRFEPARIEVPAHVKFRLQVKNTDNSPDEFESVDLNREQLVRPG
jgi:hypothetical protein